MHYKHCNSNFPGHLSTIQTVVFFAQDIEIHIDHIKDDEDYDKREYTTAIMMIYQTMTVPEAMRFHNYGYCNYTTRIELMKNEKKM